MTNKFKFYLEIPGEEILFEPYENKLLYVKRIHEDLQATIIEELTGSFTIHGELFDKVLEEFSHGFKPEILIRDSSDGFIGRWWCDEWYDIDYNKRILTFKSFTSNYQTRLNSILKHLNTEFDISVPSNPIEVYLADGSYLITLYGFEIDRLINGALLRVSGGIYEQYDTNNPWFNIAGFDMSEYCYCSVSAIRVDALGTLLSGSAAKLTMMKQFNMFEYIFRAFAYITEETIQFKTINDLVLNPLDISDKTIHLSTKQFDSEKNYVGLRLDFNTNNKLYNDEDWNHDLLYFNSGKDILELDLKHVSTHLEIGNEDLNIDGIMLFHINPLTGRLLETDGYYTENLKQNGALSASNILNTYYRNYTFTNRGGYTIADKGIGDAPINFEKIIKYPDFDIVLDDITVFHDGLIWQKDGINQIVCRTLNQTTNLKTGVTTFQTVEFSNNIN